MEGRVEREVKLLPSSLLRLFYSGHRQIGILLANLQVLPASIEHLCWAFILFGLVKPTTSKFLHFLHKLIDTSSIA